MPKPQWLEDLEKPEMEMWKSRAIAEAKRVEKLEKQIEELERKLFMATVYSVGNTPADAIYAWAQNAGHETVTIGAEVTGGDDTEFTWGYRVMCDGVSYKVAGRGVPGGFVLIWWM